MTGITFCHMCGNPLETGSKFCDQCGVETAGIHCHLCGQQLKIHDKFCSACGAMVGVTKIKEVPEIQEKFVDPNYEISLLPGEQPLLPLKRVKIKFHTNNKRKWIIDPIVGILIWVVSAALIFLIFDRDKFDAGETVLSEYSVAWFIVIGLAMFVLGWIWSLISYLRGAPKIDLFATNQRLIFRDDERTGLLTRAMLGVNIFLVLRNPLHIKKVYTTYNNLKHQVESSRDKMVHDYLILRKGTCVKGTKMKKQTLAINAFVFLVLSVFTILFPLFSIIFLILFVFSALYSIIGLFKAANPRLSFRKGECQGQLRYFVESSELDLMGLTKEEKMTIMQTFYPASA